MANPLVVLLATLGDPGQLTGGYLYHRRRAGLAPPHDARIGFVSGPGGPFPLPALAARRLAHTILDQDPEALVVDSIVAAYLAPAVRRLARLPLLASVHQPPGGMDHGPLRVRVQARFDLLVYRHISVLLVASQYLADQFVLHGIARRRLHVVPPGRDVLAGADASITRDGMQDSMSDLRQGRAAAF